MRKLTYKVESLFMKEVEYDMVLSTDSYYLVRVTILRHISRNMG
jgi:hypothetical protein